MPIVERRMLFECAHQSPTDDHFRPAFDCRASVWSTFAVHRYASVSVCSVERAVATNRMTFALSRSSMDLKVMTWRRWAAGAEADAVAVLAVEFAWYCYCEISTRRSAATRTTMRQCSTGVRHSLACIEMIYEEELNNHVTNDSLMERISIELECFIFPTIPHSQIVK